MVKGNGSAILLCCFLCLGVSADAMADFSRDAKHLEQRWAEVNYQLKGKTRLAAFTQLVIDAELSVRENPESPEALIWSGIIKASYASARNWFGAWSLAKRAREDLEAALIINPEAMQGSAYAYLGVLYHTVPRWPLAFGDDERAEELLRHALEIDPDGIDSNYLFGSFLIDQERYEEAMYYLRKAQRAPARPGRALADNGRQGEVRAALMAISDM